MRRRELIALIGGTVLARPLLAQAQAPTKQPRIALVHSGIPVERLTETGGVFWLREFFQELHRLGYAEGRNVSVERFSAEGHLDRSTDLARTVVDGNPDLIVTNGPLVRPFGTATASIPIVAIMGDPISGRITDSLARPSANITGVTVDAGIELYGKRLQIMNEALPAASRIAYLGSRAEFDGMLGQAIRDSGQRLGLAMMGASLDQATPAEFRRVFAQMAQERLDAVMVSPAGEFLANLKLIVELAASSRLPAMYPYRDFVDGGGLMAYAPDLAELARHLADQVRQVLGGAKPQDIPIYQATTFKLIVNLGAAKALDLALPPAFLTQADEVIE
jgi:putative ABC transport system substrate-binding protein